MLIHEGCKAVKLDEVVPRALGHELVPAAVAVEPPLDAVINKVGKFLRDTDGYVLFRQLVTPPATKRL